MNILYLSIKGLSESYTYLDFTLPTEARTLECIINDINFVIVITIFRGKKGFIDPKNLRLCLRFWELINPRNWVVTVL